MMRILFWNGCGRIGTKTRPQPIHTAVAELLPSCDVIALTEVDAAGTSREANLSELARTHQWHYLRDRSREMRHVAAFTRRDWPTTAVLLDDTTQDGGVRAHQLFTVDTPAGTLAIANVYVHASPAAVAYVAEDVVRVTGEGCPLILGGDLNLVRCPPAAPYQTRRAKFVDVNWAARGLTELCSDTFKPSYPYRLDGTLAGPGSVRHRPSQLDYALGNQRLLERFHCDVEFLDVYGSDHLPLLVTLTPRR